MSSAAAKRLAKRSTVGTRISALMKENGLYQSGIIIGSKNTDEQHPFFANCATGIIPTSRFVVRLENGETKEYGENELVGPGFGMALKLRSGQKVWLTHNGREVMGTVVYHQQARDEVLINVQPQSGSPEQIPFDVTKRLDEVRLLESRKSARLQEQDLDFARLADSTERNRRNQQTASIDVPKNGNHYGSRKRRPSTGSLYQSVMSTSSSSSSSSTNFDGKDNGMEECAAAMVLMSLSCSPHSPKWDHPNGMVSSSWSSSSSGASSLLSSNGGWTGSLGAIESISHLNNSSPTPSSSDDGIESDGTGDWELDQPKKKKVKIIFECTWPRCTMVKESCFEIEAHVRYAHLGPKTEVSDNHEEEFYYAEIEIPDSSTPVSSSSGGSGSYGSPTMTGLGLAFSPTLSHMDMVRPASEDPEYKMSQLQLHRKSPSNGNGNTHGIVKKRLSPKSSPIRKPRGDTKKCRKVYGMERRDLWCTQCKWKKACSRFSD